jgi:outer membrane protein TolC
MSHRRVKDEMTRWLVCAVSGLALACPAPVVGETAPAADELTLEDAVSLAIENSRRVGIKALDVQRAEEKVAASRTKRLPNIEVQAMAGTTLNPIEVTFPAGAFGSFPATGPIPSEDTVVEAPRRCRAT